MSAEWRAEVRPMGTAWRKTFLQTIPWLAVLFA